MPNKKSLVYFLLRIGVLPILLILLLMICLGSYVNMRTIYLSANAQAQRIANVMAVPASQRPLPTSLMAEQVDALLTESNRLVGINFFPINQPLPSVETNHSESAYRILFDKEVSKIAPVLVLEEDGKKTLIGYIYTTVDVQIPRKQVLYSLIMQLLLTMLLVSGFFIFLYYVIKGRASGFANLVSVSKKVASGSLERVQFLEHERSMTKEMRAFEDALSSLSAKLALAKNELKECVQQNHELKLKTQSSSFQQNTFQAMITHELKTPLNAISGGLQLIETSELNQNNRDSLSLIRRGHTKLNDMLDRIIELNNLQQGKVSVHKSVFDPEVLLKNLAEKYGQSCLEKGISITIDIKHTQTKLSGDQEKIYNILDHLVSNAVKFTRKGTISLASQIQHISDSELLCWTADVIDTGIGINQSLQEDIFNAYVQLDTGSSREFEGSGLGLTLAKKLTELMFGRLSVTSKEGEGSHFRLALELASGESDSQNSALNGLSVMHLHTGETAEFVKLLTQHGADAHGFTDINVALAAAVDKNYDVVTLCTYIEPNHAFEFGRSLRAQESLRHRSLVVYMLSGQNKRLDELELLASGIDHTYVYNDIDGFVQQINDWVDWTYR